MTVMSARDSYFATVGPSFLTKALKRLLDVAGAALGLVVLAPLFVAVAIAIKIDSPGPVMFRQERVGRNGRLFRILKFRSMAAARASKGPALTMRDDKRITQVGSFLRRSKLDELPQLLNVLVGNMSLVGPRPEVPEYMKFYTPEQRAIILSMRPGITDYASILFREENSLLDLQRDPVEFYRYQIMPIKFLYYERYSRDIGLVNDLRIILATVLMLGLGLRRCPRWLGIAADLDSRSQLQPQEAKQNDRRPIGSGLPLQSMAPAKSPARLPRAG
jgi:lipopolysaccharide/colanic/teichoic acid biosynthesis glycosyltransferase